ncbi:alpha/beta-hydrolase [Hymenopellis radicata]|nr:alpha/beta-hydrolase [Hymenopellis radicata]
MYTGKQGWLSRNHLGQSEDAFTVNVFAPDNVEASSAKLPVMVWVYGGNLNSGSSSMPLYDPTEFVRDYPCIVVTGNYRVGAFGWLATEDLKQVNGHVGNFGLHDVIAIFEWVQANISAFGGDPDNVTAYGESAGGFLIGTLLVSGRRLFTKAILQSGTYGLMVAKRNPTYAPYDELLALCSISQGSSRTERVQALKDVPTAKFLEATAALFHPGIWTLTHDPEEQGWANPVWNLIGHGEYDPWIQSVIIGINQDEGTFFNNYAQVPYPRSIVILITYCSFSIGCLKVASSS